MDSGRSALSNCIMCGSRAELGGRLCHTCRARIVGAVGLLNRKVRLVQGGRSCLGRVVNVEGSKCLVVMQGSVYSSHEVYDALYLTEVED